VGKSPISDEEYDSMLEEVKSAGALPEFVGRTYDDDPIPMELLVKHGFLSGVVVEEGKREIPPELLEEKSKSIVEVSSFADLFVWFKKFGGEKIVASVKLDGNNVKSLVSGDRFECSLTRGRGSNGFVVTKALNKVFPEGKVFDRKWIVRGECFVSPGRLDFFRKKYGDEKFKTSKSAAISLLRRPQDFDSEDFGNLKYFVFSCDGLSSTVSGTFLGLSELGFCVPPFVEIEEEFESLDVFEGRIRLVLDRLREEQGDLPADGVVFEVDDLSMEVESEDQFSGSQVAVKFYHWAPSRYRGVIKDIIVEQRRVFCCCKVEIDGIVTKDGCKATFINVFNPSFLIDSGLGVGSTIEFERKSGTVNVMVGGKKFAVLDS
jgi:NAD-dependent DNA ligase